MGRAGVAPTTGSGTLEEGYARFNHLAVCRAIEA